MATEAWNGVLDSTITKAYAVKWGMALWMDCISEAKMGISQNLGH